MLDFAIPLPLFNRRQGELEAALAEELRQDAEIALVQARIETEVAIAFEQFQGSQQIVEQYVQQILPQQEQNFRLLREGYTLGQFGLTDVLLAQRGLIDVRLDYLGAIGEFNTAIAELRQALGLVTFSTTSQTSVSGPKTAGYLVGISNSRKKGYQP
jgi:cobalt-zinc-cadmium efflux system outer membrane protein